MTDPTHTGRGFSIYARVPTRGGGSVRVQESSLAFEGPHVWLFLDGEECCEHMGRHLKPSPHLSVEQAAQLRDALAVFIAAASAGETTEAADHGLAHAMCAWCDRICARTPEAMREHALVCALHPLAAATAERDRLRRGLERIAALDVDDAFTVPDREPWRYARHLLNGGEPEGPVQP